LAHLLLHDATGDASDQHERLEMALAEAGEERDVRALAFAARAGDLAVLRVEQVDEAAMWADKAALEAADSSATEVQEKVSMALAWTRVLQGRPIDEVAVVGSLKTEGAAHPDSVARALGVRLAFRGQYEQAKAIFADLLARADERGELRFMAMIELQLCEVELRAGHVHEAARLVDDLEELLGWESTQEGALNYVTRVRALLAAIAGDPVAAGRWGRAVLERGARPTDRGIPGWDRLDAKRALGIAALIDRDASQAVEHLQDVWGHMRRAHVKDPGAFPVAGDLVDALVATEQYDEARQVIEQLSRLSADQQHPWGLATARRGESLVQLATADHYLDAAAADLEDAVASYGSLGLDFDRARSLLSLGVIQRRFKKWAAARTSLEQAADLFDVGGSLGWANRAREELNRVSGRRSAPADQLTPTETRVVRLAAGGKSNKEIARELFVSINTIEGHLSRAYAKLDVPSRSQPVHALPAGAE
jgi:DNA-binding CsgD family transcriptional regulator